MKYVGGTPEWIGMTVFDAFGNKIGKISEVYPRIGAIPEIVVGVETAPGVGAILPVVGAASTNDGLLLPYSGDQVADAPLWKPGLELTTQKWESVADYLESLDLPGDPEVPFKGGDQKPPHKKRRKKK